MNGITYFKLGSNYDGDITKNSALTGAEVDNNFYTLEGRDIRSVEIVEGKVVVNLMNGNKLSTEDVTKDCVKDLSFNFDDVNGILSITHNGETKEIRGFATNYDVGATVCTDGTILGNGLAKNPLTINNALRTGQYRPVKDIIDLTNNSKLPKSPEVTPGDRYLTIENVNEFGFLYNYDGLKRIARLLQENNSEWRIPTKEEWDDMLNSVEPTAEYKTHGEPTTNRYLGKFAGKLLKSKEYWKNDEKVSNGCMCEGNTIPNPLNPQPPKQEGNKCGCENSHYGNEGSMCYEKQVHDHKGIDKYGFNVVPSGYANDNKDYLYFGERAYFWTASNRDYRDAYIKAFAFNKSAVLQDIIATDNFLSVRLIKNFNGNNFNEREDILGQSYSTVLMPSEKNGRMIWTSVNLSIDNCYCDKNHTQPNGGKGMKFVKRYFVNEWTGSFWSRKEMLDGESVVVAKDIKVQPNDELKRKYTEYRVVEGVLMDVVSMIMENVQTNLKDFVNTLNNSIEQTNNKLNNTINDINAKHEFVTTEINKINNEKIVGLEAKTNSLEQDLTNAKQTNTLEHTQIFSKIDELKNTDNELKTRLSTIETNIDTQNGGLLGKLNQETELRKQKDNELEEKLLTASGTVFDKANGVLTLKSNGGTNDIKVQFNFDFGSF